jgi:hypothetical protein
MDILKLELITFRAQRAHLLGAHEGEYVVIVGQKILGTYASQEDAFVAGLDHCGPHEPFLLQHVTRADPEQEIPALVHGLTDAHLP